MGGAFFEFSLWRWGGFGRFGASKGSCANMHTEQMDAEGLGRKPLLTPSGDPRRVTNGPWVL